MIGYPAVLLQEKLNKMKFEYKIVSAFKAAKDLALRPQIDQEKVLNAYGRDGWELIHVEGNWNTFTGETPHYIFKRIEK